MMVSRRHNGLETRSASGVMRSAFFGWVLPLVLSAGLLAPLLAQQPAGPQEVKVRGVILERSADSFTLREYRGTERMVNLGSLTEVKEEKKNFLRPPLAYTPGDLIPGLDVQVEGLIMSGRILAKTIRFTQDALRVARAITTRVEPIETGLAQAQMGLETTGAELKSLEAHTEQQGQKLSGDIDELADAMMENKSEVERVGVQAAAAVSGAEAANQRLSQLDQYQSEDQLTIHLPAGSATISGQDQAQLDVLAERIAQRKGYLIEIGSRVRLFGWESGLQSATQPETGGSGPPLFGGASSDLPAAVSDAPWLRGHPAGRGQRHAGGAADEPAS